MYFFVSIPIGRSPPFRDTGHSTCCPALEPCLQHLRPRISHRPRSRFLYLVESSQIATASVSPSPRSNLKSIQASQPLIQVSYYIPVSAFIPCESHLQPPFSFLLSNRTPKDRKTINVRNIKRKLLTSHFPIPFPFPLSLGGALLAIFGACSCTYA